MPGIRMVDAAEGILGLEWIEGKSVRRLLPGGADEEDEDEENEGGEEEEDALREYGVTMGRSFPVSALEASAKRC